MDEDVGLLAFLLPFEEITVCREDDLFSETDPFEAAALEAEFMSAISDGLLPWEVCLAVILIRPFFGDALMVLEDVLVEFFSTR